MVKRMSLPRSSLVNPGPGGDPLPIPRAPERDNRLGMIWIMISVIGASAMAIAARQLTLEFDFRLIVVYRSGITVLALVPLLILITPLRKQLRFSRPWLHVMRGICIGVATQLGFYTFASIPLSTATVLMFTAPVFATLMSIVFHGEKVGPRRSVAIGLGFCGALVILRPGMGTMELGMLAALGNSLLFAAALTMSRGLAEADGPLSTFFSSSIVITIIAIPISLPVWRLPTTSSAWIVIAILIITGAVRNIADIQAYRHAESAVLTPLIYLRLVFIGAAAYLIFGEVPDQQTLLGAIIIISATLYVARRESLAKRARSKP